MTSAFDAVIFDLDGTLIDTEALCNATGVAACRALGHDVLLSFFKTLAGIHDAERTRLLSRFVGQPIEPGAFYRVWDDLCTQVFAAGIPHKPGAIDLLQRIGGMGLPVAIATSSRRAPAMEKITLAGFGPLIRSIVTFDCIARPKPAPDAYLEAAKRLGADPTRCLAFEDSDPGAQAAWDAGMTVVQVPDIASTKGRHAHHVAATLLQGAAAAGLLHGVTGT
jgi:HAD superfamily hydrolase (TIGR01509 family)